MAVTLGIAELLKAVKIKAIQQSIKSAQEQLKDSKLSEDVMAAEYGCEIVVDLSKLEHLPEVSCYNNNWYKNRDVFIFVKCLEEYNQVDIYISDKINGNKVFLISDHWNHEEIYTGEVGFEWT